MTTDEIKILVAIRSLQPTSIRAVADHLWRKSQSHIVNRLYGWPGNPGLIERGYVISTGANTMRLTEQGWDEISQVAYVNDYQEKRPVVIRKVEWYEPQREIGTGRLVDSRAVYEVGK